MELKEKAAYLKGLADGLTWDKTTPEGKLISAMLDLLSELTAAVEENSEAVDYLNDYAEELDEDLGELEKVVYEVDDDEDDYEYEDEGMIDGEGFEDDEEDPEEDN